MNNLVWDAVLWLRKKLNGDKRDIIQAVNNIQNLFETSVDATASASDILEGQTAYNGTTLLTGSMKDRRGTTVTSEAVTQDANYTYFAVPEEACYNENSKVRALNSNINPKWYAHCVTVCGYVKTHNTQGITNNSNIFSVTANKEDDNFVITIKKSIRCAVSCVIEMGGTTPTYAIYKNGISISLAAINGVIELSVGDIIKCVTNNGQGGVSIASLFICTC